jgi:hypothetical protein
MSSDAPGTSQLFAPGVWGIFTSGGGSVIQSDSVIDVEYRNDYRISSAPQEQGSFASYNKVSEPFAGHVTFAQGGDDDDRNEFIAAIAAAQQSLNLYMLVMPDHVYPSLNIVHYDFKRTQKSGVSLLLIEVGFEEVRVTGTTQYSTTATPAGADPVPSGTTQPTTPTPAQVQNANPSGQQIAPSDSAASAPANPPQAGPAPGVAPGPASGTANGGGSSAVANPNGLPETAPDTSHGAGSSIPSGGGASGQGGSVPSSAGSSILGGSSASGQGGEEVAPTASAAFL